VSIEPRVFVSLGANLGDCRRTFELARRAIAELPGTEISGFSAERETAPVGVVDQREFLNQVLKLSTNMEPVALLYALLDIERSLGRVRAERWGPRTIDLDILFYGPLRLESPVLTVPHPELGNRPFFLEMVAEIDSGFLGEWPEFSATGRG
jgi:2-amino-4-hydroxy-6-hydroxymethyldihydropteridine diphosphokinase